MTTSQGTTHLEQFYAALEQARAGNGPVPTSDLPDPIAWLQSITKRVQDTPLQDELAAVIGQLIARGVAPRAVQCRSVTEVAR